MNRTLGVCASTFALLSVTFAPASTAQSVSESRADAQRESQRLAITVSRTKARNVVALVNRARRNRGLVALKAQPCPTRFAVRWSKRMARTGEFRHQSLTPILIECNGRMAGENIAYGQTTAKEVFRAWMNSPGHRSNILNPEFRRIGVGVARRGSGPWYWTQDFVR